MTISHYYDVVTGSGGSGDGLAENYLNLLWPSYYDVSGGVTTEYQAVFMSTKLFDLTYQVAREVGRLIEGKAVTGTVSSLTDTKDRTEEIDYWNGGTVWILRDAGQAGAAPEREYSIIDDSGGGVIALRSTLTAAIGTGDVYAIMDNQVPLYTIISKINQAILALGNIPITDTSLTVSANKTEYTLPASASLNLIEVYVQTINTDPDDNQWTPVRGFKIQRALPGQSDTLILPDQYGSGYKLKLVYGNAHPTLYNFDDVLSDAVPAERIVYPAALACLMELKTWTRRADWDFAIADLQARVNKVVAERVIPVPKASAGGHIFIKSKSASYGG